MKDSLAKSFLMRYLATSGILGWIFWLVVGVVSLLLPENRYRMTFVAVLLFAAFAAIPAGLWTWFSYERRAMKELNRLRSEVSDGAEQSR